MPSKPQMEIVFKLPDPDPKDGPPPQRTRILYKDGSTEFYGTVFRPPAYGWSASYMNEEPDPPDSLRSFSHNVSEAGKNLLTVMTQPLEEAVLGFYQYGEVCPRSFVSHFDRNDGPIEFDGLPYASWHEAMLFIFNQVRTVWHNEFSMNWTYLGDVTWIEFQKARANVIYSRWSEAEKQMDELGWEFGDVAQVWHYLKFERELNRIDEPPAKGGGAQIDDPITRLEISILSEALSPGKAKDEKTVYNRFPHKNGPVPFPRNGGPGAASYSEILPYLEDFWPEIPWPERYKDALAAIRSQLSNRE